MVQHRWTGIVHEEAKEGGSTLCGVFFEGREEYERVTTAVTCKSCTWWQQAAADATERMD